MHVDVSLQVELGGKSFGAVVAGVDAARGIDRLAFPGGSGSRQREGLQGKSRRRLVISVGTFSTVSNR